MKRLFYIVALLFVAVACEKEASFSCRVIEHGVEGVTETSATLSATVYASNYGAIDRMGRVEDGNQKVSMSDNVRAQHEDKVLSGDLAISPRPQGVGRKVF